MTIFVSQLTQVSTQVIVKISYYPSSVTFRGQQVLDKPFHPEE
ncbi:hypothetical protein [Chroococcidiopsis sp [FACHB-1243]]|nr:hypothetical protein [Chroococcidiopsis sp. [FACHB-1243]]